MTEAALSPRLPPENDKRPTKRGEYSHSFDRSHYNTVYFEYVEFGECYCVDILFHRFDPHINCQSEDVPAQFKEKEKKTIRLKYSH